MLSTVTQLNQAYSPSGASFVLPCLAAPAGLFLGVDMKHIPLTKGQFALVDDEDFEQLNKYTWFAYKTKYGGFSAIRNARTADGRKTTIKMHRQIMNAPLGMDVDHRNHTTLDNQKHNLRICTRQQNLRNSNPRKNCSSQFKGVARHKGTGKWRAYVNFDGKQCNLGLFETEAEAAEAYNRKAIEIFGDFACLNFPNEWPEEFRVREI